MPVINVITKNDNYVLTANEEDFTDIVKIELTVGLKDKHPIQNAVFLTKKELTAIANIYGEK